MRFSIRIERNCENSSFACAARRQSMSALSFAVGLLPRSIVVVSSRRCNVMPTTDNIVGTLSASRCRHDYHNISIAASFCLCCRRRSSPPISTTSARWQSILAFGANWLRRSSNSARSTATTLSMLARSASVSNTLARRRKVAIRLILDACCLRCERQRHLHRRHRHRRISVDAFSFVCLFVCFSPYVSNSMFFFFFFFFCFCRYRCNCWRWAARLIEQHQRQRRQRARWFVSSLARRSSSRCVLQGESSRRQRERGGRRAARAVSPTSSMSTSSTAADLQHCEHDLRKRCCLFAVCASRSIGWDINYLLRFVWPISIVVCSFF